MLQNFKLEADMQEVRGNVIGLNSFWNNCILDRPFHTIRASKYLDIRRKDVEVKTGNSDRQSNTQRIKSGEAS
jgi:hypothetical protein